MVTGRRRIEHGGPWLLAFQGMPAPVRDLVRAGGFADPPTLAAALGEGSGVLLVCATILVECHGPWRR